MYDNSRPHVDRVVQLEEVWINSMVWPARSTDLKPIENLWDTVGGRLQEEHNQLNILVDVGRKFVQIWEEMNQNEIWPLILSMNRHWKNVIDARGINTCYCELLIWRKISSYCEALIYK